MTSDPRAGIAAILLAAGASTRLGRPKQLVLLGHENLVERSVRIAIEAGCSPTVVVLGASADLIQQKSILPGAQIVFNPGWQEGIATSIHAGLDALPAVAGTIVMACDMPAVTSSHLRSLCASGKLTASSYSGRRGVPAYLPQSFFPALRTLRGDKGARDLLALAPTIELLCGELDIDTEEDLQRAQSLRSSL